MNAIRTPRLFAFAAACAAALSAFVAPPAQAQESRAVTIKQVSSGRFLTAYRDAGHDFRVVTRSSFNPKTCVWLMTPLGGDVHVLRHVAGSARFLDAHEIPQKDFHLVTRPRQTFDSTQLWRLVPRGGGNFTFVQVSSGRFMDAHEYAGKDFGVVTRPPQDNATQLWQVASYLGNIEF